MARLRATHDHRQWLAEGHSSFEARFFLSFFSFLSFFPSFFLSFSFLFSPRPEKSVYRKSSIRITTRAFTRAWEKCQLAAGRVGKGNLPRMTNLPSWFYLCPSSLLTTRSRFSRQISSLFIYTKNVIHHFLTHVFRKLRILWPGNYLQMFERLLIQNSIICNKKIHKLIYLFICVVIGSSGKGPRTFPSARLQMCT